MNTDGAGSAYDVLVVSNQQADLERIRGMRGASGEWKCHWVRTALELYDVVRTQPVPVVVCRTELPDSNWKGVLASLQDLQVPPSVIVLTDREDIDLWTEVLNQGGFDILHKGVNRESALHTLQQAFRRWKRRNEILSARRMNPRAEEISDTHIDCADPGYDSVSA